LLSQPSKTDMEFISVFDVFKIGIGPSSSHTLGPWKSSLRFMDQAWKAGMLESGTKVTVSLFGSLSLTGKGHATDLAVIMGLSGYDPVTVQTMAIEGIIEDIQQQKRIITKQGHCISFDPKTDIKFEKTFLPFHANGLIFTAEKNNGDVFSETYYSIGGGFIIWEGEELSVFENAPPHPYPIQNNAELLQYCRVSSSSISEIVLANELVDRSNDVIEQELLNIWHVMLDSMFAGCHQTGYLPGILKVKRRAAEVVKAVYRGPAYTTAQEWLSAIRNEDYQFQDIMKWVGSFAIAVNETNAAFGRVVTAPTNGSAGVIPAVIMYYLCFINKHAGNDEIVRFLLTAGEIGSIFKKGSTISAAMGGCQAEIGVSSAMAAAGLTELMGGSPEQCSIAAEVAMEHHLGMTCDPIAGLVQIPCIERNSMGAIKAINAAAIAIDRDPQDVKVPLDYVIATMWETAKDMNRKYKETSEGGLAATVNLIDC
jgi:L-serine dehydratase